MSWWRRHPRLAFAVCRNLLLVFLLVFVFAFVSVEIPPTEEVCFGFGSTTATNGGVFIDISFAVSFA